MFIKNTVVLGLKYLPDSLKSWIRTVMPVSMKRKLSRAVMSEPDKDNIEVSTKYGTKFVNSTQNLFLKVRYEGDYEPEFTQFLLNFIEEDDIAVDIGANFGWYSITIGTKLNSGSVFAFEPTPSSFDLLEQNIHLNNLSDRINISQCCVSNNQGSVFFKVGDQALGALNHVELNETAESIKIPSVVLDNELSQYINNIAFIKIDVEGHEYSVLEGCSEILSAENKPVLQIELNKASLNNAGSSAEQVIDFLKRHDYQFAIPTGNGFCQRVDDPFNQSDLLCYSNGKYGQRLLALVDK